MGIMRSRSLRARAPELEALAERSKLDIHTLF